MKLAIRTLGLFVALTMGTTALAGCSVFNMRPCDEIDAIDRAKIRQCGRSSS